MSEEATERDLLDTGGTPRATTRRPRAARNGGGQKVTQVTRREFIEDETQEDEVERLQMPGVFAMEDIEGNSIVRARVYRKDPDEGMLGYIDDPTFSESEIQSRWGGSLYRVDGLNANGQCKKSVTFRLAGDPIFVSETFRLEWAKRKGMPLYPQGTQTPAPAALSPTDMLSFMRAADDDRRKAEDERRQREASERREHEERMRKLELEAEATRRKDDIEREDRRRRDEEERDRRRKADQEASEQRARQHTEQMLAMIKQSNDQALAVVRQQAAPANGPDQLMTAVKMVVAIKEAFGGEGGGAGGDGESDPLTLLMKHGHEWLGSIGNAIQGAIREVKGGGAVAGPPQQQQLQPQPSPEGLTIPASSPLAGKLQTLVTEIAQRGHNPEQVLSQLVDNSLATLRRAPRQPQPPSDPIVTPPPAAETPPAAAEAAPPAPPAPPAAPPPTRTVPRTGIGREMSARGSARISFRN